MDVFPAIELNILGVYIYYQRMTQTHYFQFWVHLLFSVIYYCRIYILFRRLHIIFRKVAHRYQNRIGILNVLLNDNG